MKRIVTVVTLFAVKWVTGYPAAGDGVEIGLTKTSALQQFTNNLGKSLFPQPQKPEVATFEQPTLLQKADSIYDNAQKLVANVLHPKPIVDTISEEEKYGNAGDQFRPIGNLVVNGYEGFSNFLNAAADLPFEAMKAITRKVTSSLSNVGLKIVGLQ